VKVILGPDILGPDTVGTAAAARAISPPVAAA
jgi:hypothetical protein